MRDKIKSTQDKIKSYEQELVTFNERDVSVKLFKYEIDPLNSKVLEQEK